MRSLAYLLASLVAGVAGFVWSMAAVLIIGAAAPTAVGGTVFKGVAWATQHLSNVERRRAGWLLRVRVEPGAGHWRAVAWFLALFPLGLAGGIAAISGTVVTAAMIVAPAWAWSVPQRRAPHLIVVLMGTGWGNLVLTALGLALVVPVLWAIRRLAWVQANAARLILAPSERDRLAQRVSRLAQTRARVVDAQAAELRRIERDLHDGAQARIVAAGMTLALLERRLPTEPASDLAGEVRAARRQLDDALAELRRLVRGIHPPILTDRGLPAALHALATDSPIPVTVSVALPRRLAPALESAAYFVVAEGLANAVKHSDASACTVTIAEGVVEVADDGIGGADALGAGFDGLRRRVEALDGELKVTSPVGGPTVIRAEFP